MFRNEEFQSKKIKIQEINIIEEKNTFPLERASSLIDNRPNWPEFGSIEFKNVSLRYRTNTEIVLKNISFKVEKGMKRGIVGRTGAGKSTIS